LPEFTTSCSAGRDNYAAADRAAAEKVIEQITYSALACRQNRDFLGRVVMQGYFKMTLQIRSITLGSHTSGSPVRAIGHRRRPSPTRTLRMQVYR
jgi:hypothetical protein